MKQLYCKACGHPLELDYDKGLVDLLDQIQRYVECDYCHRANCISYTQPTVVCVY